MLADAIENSHLVAGVVLNSVLLTIIRNLTKVSLGTYKHILTLFVSCDLILVVIHGLVNPKVVLLDWTFAATTDTFIESRITIIFFSTSFTLPFVLLNIHFLYRYWTVRNPDRIELFKNPIFIFALITGTFALLSFWFCVCTFGCTGADLYDEGTEAVREAYYEKYGKRIMDGWIVMDHFRNGRQDPRITLSLLLFDAIMIGSFTIALSLGALTYSGIRSAKTMSAQSRSLQLKLLTAVTAQTLVPLIFVYIPYFFVLNLPYFGIAAPGLGDQSMLMTACFPAWDAVIIISLIADFRDAALRMTPLTRWIVTKKNAIIATPSMTTRFESSVKLPRGVATIYR